MTNGDHPFGIGNETLLVFACNSINPTILALISFNFPYLRLDANNIAPAWEHS